MIGVVSSFGLNESFDEYDNDTNHLLWTSRITRSVSVIFSTDLIGGFRLIILSGPEVIYT